MIVLWIHWLAAISFIGGMLFYFLVYHPALLALNATDTSRLSKRVDQRFKTFRWLALMVLLGTGVMNLLSEGDSLLMASSSYGGKLAIKLLLVMVVFVLMGVYDFVLTPKAAAKTGSGDKQTIIHRISKAQRWIGWVVIVLCLGIVWVAMELGAM